MSEEIPLCLLGNANNKNVFAFKGFESVFESFLIHEIRISSDKEIRSLKPPGVPLLVTFM